MIIKHFTSTVFVVFKNKIFLHWHAKVKEWLPPGGHIELNEAPIETATRETLEELCNARYVKLISDEWKKINN